MIQGNPAAVASFLVRDPHHKGAHHNDAGNPTAAANKNCKREPHHKGAHTGNNANCARGISEEDIVEKGKPHHKGASNQGNKGTVNGNCKRDPHHKGAKGGNGGCH